MEKGKLYNPPKTVVSVSLNVKSIHFMITVNGTFVNVKESLDEYFSFVFMLVL